MQITINKIKVDFEDFDDYHDIFLTRSQMFLSSLKLQKNDVIYDYGCDIGLSSIAFSIIYPQVKIMAYEPNKALYSIAELNINSFQSKNKINNIILLSEPFIGEYDVLKYTPNDDSIYKFLDRSKAKDIAVLKGLMLEFPLTITRTRKGDIEPRLEKLSKHAQKYRWLSRRI
jgi:hypothetical protein